MAGFLYFEEAKIPIHTICTLTVYENADDDSAWIDSTGSMTGYL